MLSRGPLRAVDVMCNPLYFCTVADYIYSRHAISSVTLRVLIPLTFY